MAQGTFSAEVKSDVAQTKEWMLAVFRESAQRTIEIVQTPVSQGGAMPVKTGFLRASGQALIGDAGLPLVENPNPDAAPGSLDTFNAGAVSLVIANAGIEDTITFAYTANYAIFANYGARGHAGHQFVGLGAQRWPQIVDQVSREAEARARR
jgi:hypothetical protein